MTVILETPGRSKKYSGSGVVRTVPPRVTVGRAASVMERIGVTRVTEVTGLDRVGIPNFMTVRPRDLGPGISYYNGKGLTKAAAKAGAMMEAVERYCGERWSGPPPLFATYGEIRKRGPAVDPADIIIPRVREYERGMRLEWIEGNDLLTGRATWVPLNSVLCPYEPPRNCALFYASTNGLASGNTMEEALCHALCEVVERDALAIALAALELSPAVRGVLELLGHPAGSTSGPDRFPLIDLATLPASASALVERFRKASIRVYLRNITVTAGIASIDCTIVEQTMGGQLVHGGCGTHPDARVALTRALTEAAQSRVACIQGGREDLPEIVKPPRSFDADALYGAGRSVPFSAVPTVRNDTIDADIRLILGRLAADGFAQVVAIDLTDPEIGIPVVRVVVPRAEAWTVFHLHTGRGVFGERVARALAAPGGEA